MRNFWGTIFIWTHVYREIVKSALVYLQEYIKKNVGFYNIFHKSHAKFENTKQRVTE